MSAVPRSAITPPSETALGFAAKKASICWVGVQGPAQVPADWIPSLAVGANSVLCRRPNAGVAARLANINANGVALAEDPLVALDDSEPSAQTITPSAPAVAKSANCGLTSVA